ncbi:MAG TPA: asparagine synthase (glutamine-hydrolyzing) [Pedobacter sp.]|jgi:asparagine synthase (glutamine-hydrolysing)
MCRIAGIIAPKKSSLELRTQVQSMCNLMRHGGPDDEGIFSHDEQKLCFGHRRLSLLDLSTAGHQPMADEQQRCYITFNGEIYNFKELRHDLEKKGHSFKSNTDTEVILAAYLEWGADCFKLFNGMFAFALYDTIKKQVFLVRDAVGIKPLYYHSRRSGELFFSSEVKAFKQINPNWPESADWRILLLCFGHIPEPHTTLHGVKALAKGHYLQYDLVKKEIVTIQSYRRIGFSEIQVKDKQEALTLIRSQLRRAVKRHLISDAPIGLFLSGGIDSSLLTLLAAESGQKGLHTLSVTFSDSDYSEQEYQEAVIEKVNCRHKYNTVEQSDFEIEFSNILAAYDQPSNDGINSWFISKSAHQTGLKAVLSGLGSDEIFGGYPSFGRMENIFLVNRLPEGALKLSRYLSQVPLQRLSWLQIKKPVGLYLTIRGLYTPEEAGKLSGLSTEEVIAQIEQLDYSPSFGEGLPENQAASILEFNLYMQNQLLKDSDYMSMQHGLELRVPFLDQEFLDAIFSIDPALLYHHNGLPKQLLIDAFRDILPEKIWNRKKMGFSFPFEKWFGNIPQIRESISATEAGKELMQSFDKKQSHWSKVWAYYLTQNFKA